jgi:hypothetical protein
MWHARRFTTVVAIIAKKLKKMEETLPAGRSRLSRHGFRKLSAK